jgi:NitT/TauT family transport system substrate-binding protein
LRSAGLADATSGNSCRQAQGRQALTMARLFIKDPNVHRRITPAAIDPDGRLGLDSLRNDLVFFKEQRLIADPGMTVERIIDTSFAEQAAKALGPYQPRGK